jgi:hypothetical protein
MKWESYAFIQDPYVVWRAGLLWAVCWRRYKSVRGLPFMVIQIHRQGPDGM